MLFSQDKNDQNKNNAAEPKKRSIWGTLFNPDIGKDISPLKESWRMFSRLIASILVSNRLFPKDHPAFTDSTYPITFKEVIATSWARLSFTKEGIPQIALFFAVMGCLFFTALFLITLIFSFFISPSRAAPSDSIFTAPAADSDFALGWLDYVFLGKAITYTADGVSNATQSCFMQAGLSSLLSFYSAAILVLGGFILLFHLTTMIAETAHSGKFMGRANQVWAPIRLVVAIGLLIPLTSTASSNNCSITGYNTGQYMVMKIAKWGSSMASNGWSAFLDKIDNYAAASTACEGSPSCVKVSPQVSTLAKSMISNYACAKIYNYYIDEMGMSSRIANNVEAPVAGGAAGEKVLFGTNRPYTPTICGGYQIPAIPDATDNLNVYKEVYSQQADAFKKLLPDFNSVAEDWYKTAIEDTTQEESVQTQIATAVREKEEALQSALSSTLLASIKVGDIARNNSLKTATDNMKEYGWLSAGAWFNTIARFESERASSVSDGIPQSIPPSLYDMDLKEKNKIGRNSIKGVKTRAYQALIRFDSLLSLPSQTTKNTAELASVYKLDDFSTNANPVELFFKLINQIGGWVGLWDANGDLAIKFDKTRNPLAEVAALGQKYVTTATWILTTGAVLYIAGNATDKAGDSWLAKGVGLLTGGATAALTGGIVAALNLVAVGLILISSIFFSIGVTLGFLMPLFPFFRFFFGAITWLLNVMVCVVGMPLFALAHLSPYGDGFQGQRATGGYFYLLQIFLRPILMIMGLIAGFILFSAAITFLNTFFIIAAKGTGNFVGSTPTIAKIFYSIIYCAIAYILCNKCFQAVGTFPQTALHWLGASGLPEEKMGDVGAMTAAAGYLSNQGFNQVEKVFKGPGDVMKMIGEKKKNKLALAQEEETGRLANERFQDEKSYRDKTLMYQEGIAERLGVPQQDFSGQEDLGVTKVQNKDKTTEKPTSTGYASEWFPNKKGPASTWKRGQKGPAGNDEGKNNLGGSGPTGKKD